VVLHLILNERGEISEAESDYVSKTQKRTFVNPCIQSVLPHYLSLHLQSVLPLSFGKYMDLLEEKLPEVYYHSKINI
jgi:hypothetical protein